MNGSRLHISIWSRLVFCVFFLCLVSCKREELGNTQTPVILISIDTLRSDRLPAYGYTAIQTPAIDALRGDGVLFERAYAPVPLTLGSHASMMTGTIPPNHGVRDNTGYVLAEEFETLAERLHGVGYETAGVVSSMVLRKGTGIAQGFDFYDDRFERESKSVIGQFAQRRGDKSIALAQTWLEAKSETPFFLFLHLYDPHTPYRPPRPFAQGYDGEIRYTDSLLEGFFNYLKEKGLYEKSLIFLVSDHGEGLDDHGEKEHGMLLYREALQVPFIVKYPGQKFAGRTVKEPVGLIDIRPTLEETLGLSASKTDGVSLVDLSGVPASRELYAESLFAKLHFGWFEQKSVIRRELHLIEGSETELYDMIQDPAERNNLFGTEAIPASMFTLLERVGAGQENQVTISEEDKAMLESLGYTGGFDFGADVQSLSFGELVDLKETIASCQRSLNEGEFATAEAELLKLLGQYPTMQDAKVLLGIALKSQEKYESADNVLMEGLAFAPEDHRLLTLLAEVKLAREKWADALTVAEKAVNTDAAYAIKALLPYFYTAERFSEAVALAQLATEKGVDYGYAYYVLGRAAGNEEQIPRAVGLYEKAAEMLEPDSERDLLVSTLVFLAGQYAAQQDYSRVIETLERAFETNPSITNTRTLLARAYLQGDRMGDSEQILEDGLARDPNHPELLRQMSEVMLARGFKDRALSYAEKALVSDTEAVAGPICFSFLTGADPETAEKLANLVIRFDAGAPYPYFVLGRLAHGRKEFGPAQQHLGRCLENLRASPDPALLADTLYFLGDTEASLGDARRAMAYFQEAVKVRPSSAQFQLTLTAFFVRLGDRDSAISVTDGWLGQFPQKRNYDQAAQVMRQLGFAEKADEYAKRAAALSPHR